VGAYLQELGASISFGRLSLKGKVIWPMLLAASDDQGRGLAEADVVKWHVCPNVREIEIEDLDAILTEMVAQDMILLYQDERGRALYQVVNWWVHQKRRFARPSLYESPEGWVDRVRLQRGSKGLQTVNWDRLGGFADQERLPEPGEDTSIGQYGGQYGREDGGQYGAPELNRTKLNRTKPPPPTSPVGKEDGGGGGVSLNRWEQVFRENIGKMRPKAREKIRGLFEDPEVTFALWDEAVGIAVANENAKLSYVLGVIRRRLGRNGDGSPGAGLGRPTKRHGRLPGRGGDDDEN
jgi:hypothetical protein